MNTELEIEISRISPEVPLPKYETSGAVAFDISAFEDKFIESQQITLIRTGLVLSVPVGYCLILANRSSGPKKLGLSLPHGIGIIDQDYRGPDDELLIQVANITDKVIEIKKDTRIAQGLIVPIIKAKWREISIDERGTSRGGFGSTGGHNL